MCHYLKNMKKKNESFFVRYWQWVRIGRSFSNAYMCPCILSLHGGYLMGTAPFPGNRASKQTFGVISWRAGGAQGSRTSEGQLILVSTYQLPALHIWEESVAGWSWRNWRNTEDFVCFCSFPPQVAAWINEKNSIAQDDSWKDPSNLQTKLQRHQTFQAEIMANRNHLDSIKSVRELGFWARVGNWHERLQTVWVTVISKKGGGGTVISLVLSMLNLSAMRSLFF